MISGNDIRTLRAIARVNGDYARVKSMVALTTWMIEEDDVDLGFMRIVIPDATDANGYGLIIGYQDPSHPPYAFVTFYTFSDSEENFPAFDTTFHYVADVLQEHLGEPSASGELRPSTHAWSYAYHRWSLPEGEFTLVKNAFDVQTGLDVTLWIEIAGTPINSGLY